MDKDQSVRIDLERDEAEVLQVASRIFSAYILGKQCTEENEDEMMKKSIDLAIRLTQSVDRAVSAGNEVKSQLQDSSFHRPLG